jgi:hypothetical protein
LDRRGVEPLLHMIRTHRAIAMPVVGVAPPTAPRRSPVKKGV